MKTFVFPHHSPNVRNGRQTERRAGTTLLEALLSVLILGLALAAIGQMVSRGVQASVRCELESEAALRCQTKLDEVLSGAEPLRDVHKVSFKDDAQWQWGLTLQPGTNPDLVAVTVTVDRVSPGPSAAVAASYSLTRSLRLSSIPANSSPTILTGSRR